MQELFDIPEEYDSMLQQGIALTGNDRHFFIHGRFDFLQQKLPVGFRPKLMLDYGCGTGDASAELASRFPQALVHGFDASAKAMAYASRSYQHSNLEFLLEKAPAPASYDLIFLNCVIHHIQPKQRALVMQEITSLLKPGGLLWIFENNPANPGTRWAMYRNPFDRGVVKVWPSQLENFMKQCGIEIHGKGFLFYFPQWLSWFRPMEKWLQNLPLGGQYAIWGSIKTSKGTKP